MYFNDSLTKPDASIRGLLMRFQHGATAAPSLSDSQRCYILGKTTDVNLISWLPKQSLLHTQSNTPINIIPSIQLPKVTTNNPLLKRNYSPPQTLNLSSPQPTMWQPLFNSSEWIYTDGSLKTGKPRQGASGIHSPTHIHHHIYECLRAR